MSFFDLMALPFFKGFVDITKDGKYFLYSSNESGKPQLYMKTTEAFSEPRQLTFGDLHVKTGYFSPKEDMIAFQAEEFGNELYHLYILGLKDKKNYPKKISQNAYFSDSLSWHSNNTEIARAVRTPDFYGIEIFNLETKKSFFLRKLKDPLGDVQYSKDGKWLAYTVVTGGGKGAEVHVQNRTLPNEIYIYSISDTTQEMMPCLSPDGKWLAMVTNSGGKWHVIIQEFLGAMCIHLDLDNAEEVVTNISGTADFKLHWHPNSTKIYYIFTKHSRSYIRGHLLSNKREEPLPFPNGENGPFAISEDGKTMVSFNSSMTSPNGIYAHKIGMEKAYLVSPKSYKDNLLEILAIPESIWFESFDGLKIHGWYLKGHGASKESPVPALLYIHGGPADQVFDEWTQGVYLQAMSQLGYSVFAINYRGSTGYGIEFLNMNQKDFGGGDLEDCVYAAKWLRTKQEIRLNKIGIVGASYGGFMTLMALTTKPEVFNAGVSMVPVVDWISNFSMFKEHYTNAFGGTPDDKLELYKERSPIIHAKSIKSPVLIIGAANDARCPIEPIRKFVNILKEMNHPYKYIERGQDGHTSMMEDANDRIKDFRAILKFLKKYLS